MVVLFGGDVDRGETLRRTAPGPGEWATVFTPMLLAGGWMACALGLLLVMALALLCKLCGDGLSAVRISMAAGGGVVRGDEMVEFCAE